jgi:hypothetical protein
MKNNPKKFNATEQPTIENGIVGTSYEETLKAAGDMYTKYVHRIADKERNTDMKYEVETDETKHFENPLDEAKRKF